MRAPLVSPWVPGTEAFGVFDRVQLRERRANARRAVDVLRSEGAVPALLAIGRSFGAANRALLGV